MSKIERSDIEIMAPVGSYESLVAAIENGANSVYFGIEKLNMRSRSSNNFTIEDLQKIVEICRDSGIKTYLTVNTVIYDGEMDLMHEILDAAKKFGITAVIASDFSAILYARQIDLEVHISTQCNVTNIAAVRFFSQFADVIVLARELNLEQVKNIHNQIEREGICGPKGELIKIEMFAHGALCMAVSGKCYLSLDNLNASANRGECLQVCRRKYLVRDLESDNELVVDGKYIMSPKDLKTIDFLDILINAGVRVLKIEGRARSADYVATVCHCYNEAINAIVAGEFTEKRHSWDERLSRVFNRGFWGGYYLGQKAGQWSENYGNLATERKVYVGKVTNFFERISVGEFLIETGEINDGDKVMIMGHTTGVIELIINELRVDDKVAQIAKKGTLFSIKLPKKVRRNDKLYKVVSSHFVKDNQ